MPIPTTTDAPWLTREMGEQIAKHLTPGLWANIQDDNHGGDYEHGRRLTLRYVGEDDTLTGAQLTALAPLRGVSVEWSCSMWGPDSTGGYLVDKLPYQSRKDWPGSHLNISSAKSPERIGRELSRRLLSYYLPAYREGMAGLARELAEKAADGVLAAELAALAGTKAWQFNNQDNMPWRINAGPDPGKVRLTCQYGLVHCEAFSMSPDQARQLVQLVRTWGDKA